MKLIFLLFLAMSCSSQPQLYKGGAFGNIKLDEETYLVSFHGDYFSLKPLPDRENFDAKAIYTARLRAIHTPKE